MSIPYQGDIKKVLLGDESGFTMSDGSATRDEGIENAIMYSLFITNWFANQYATNSTQELRGRFLIESSKTITSVQLLNIEDAAKKDLAWMVSAGIAKSVTAVTTVEASGRVTTIIEVFPPDGAASSSFSVSEYANSWQLQVIK